jgi:uncharacterized protein YgbK (DUF1537 family)
VRHTDGNAAAEVTAIDTDSRSSPTDFAQQQMRAIAGQLSRYPGARIFKKVDSLLRGQPRAEIEALIQAVPYDGALLIPANPSRGRTISGGFYFIQGTPLNKTLFADDPEFPRTSAKIDSLIAAGGLPIHNIRWPAKLPPRGVIVPDVESTADVKNWASTVNASILPVGAADFFAAMLNRWCGSAPNQQSPTSEPIRLPALLVCGSHAAWQSRKNDCAASNLPLMEVGSTSLNNAGPVDSLIAASEVLRSRNRLVLSSGQTMIPHADRVARLQSLAHTAAIIVRQDKPATLLLEGGATAAAVVSQLDWKQFSVLPAGTSGVGFLKPIDEADAPLLLVKPGSYAWPPEIWQSFCG